MSKKKGRQRFESKAERQTRADEQRRRLPVLIETPPPEEDDPALEALAERAEAFGKARPRE